MIQLLVGGWWSWKGGSVVRLERCECGKVGKVGRWGRWDIFTNPPQTAFPHISLPNLFFLLLPIFSSKSPPKDKQDFNRWSSSELFKKNCFFGRLSHFSAFEPIIQNPKSTCTSNGSAPFPSSETSPRKHERSPFTQSQPFSVRGKSPQSRFADNHKQDFIL